MNKLIATSLLVLSASVATASAPFGENFNDSTLRIDYVFGGGPDGVSIFVDNISKSAGWSGRRARLDHTLYPGNGSIEVKDPSTGKTLYKNTFSSLFQEWVLTPEAKTTPRSFENTFLVPLPKGEADICITLLDNRHQTVKSVTHRYDPKDELTEVKRESPYYKEYIHKGGDPKEAIDFAIVAEGYTAADKDLFLEDARRLANEILSYEPFASRKDRFNVVAVLSESNESGVSIPLENKWVDTAFSSHYSTFHSSRYLTAPDVKKMHDALTGVPYEHLIVLVNSDRYGGGGIFNSYLLSTTRNEHSLPVVVHEFGHSFGGLADEYYYVDEQDDTFPLDVEPWEPNITTRVDFASKWQDMVKPGTPLPTPTTDKGGNRAQKMSADKKRNQKDPVIGLYEGGGYKAKGVFRPVETCRMRDNYYPAFCPVCERALTRLIDFYTLPE